MEPNRINVAYFQNLQKSYSWKVRLKCRTRDTAKNGKIFTRAQLILYLELKRYTLQNSAQMYRGCIIIR